MSLAKYLYVSNLSKFSLIYVSVYNIYVQYVVSLTSVRGSQTSHNTMSVHTTHNAYTRVFIVIQLEVKGDVTHSMISHTLYNNYDNTQPQHSSLLRGHLTTEQDACMHTITFNS